MAPRTAAAWVGAEAEAIGVERVLSIQLPLHKINCRRPAPAPSTSLSSSLLPWPPDPQRIVCSHCKFEIIYNLAQLRSATGAHATCRHTPWPQGERWVQDREGFTGEVEWSRCRLYGSFASQLQFIDFPSSKSSRNTKERAINFHLFCRQRGRRSRMQSSTKAEAQATVMATATGATTLAGCSGKHIAHSQTFGTLPRSRVTRHGISSGFWLKSGCLFLLSHSLYLSLSLTLSLLSNYFLPIHCLYRNWVDCLWNAAFFALLLQMMMMAMADDERFAKACRRWRRSFCHCFRSCACNFLHCSAVHCAL